jgi:tetratricopeptide (TPR) repeat protein
MGRKSRHKIVRPPAPLAPARVAAPPARTSADWLIVAALVILIFLVFGQVTSHKFLNYDDGQFVYENTHVSQGLTASSVKWALTSAEIGYYPLTWLSHELDVAMWGLSAGRHLLTNVAIHAVTSCLLFFALLALTGQRGAAAFIAALFAIHPMHVESVAWVSERKDTLSTLFIVIALLLYARDPTRKWGVFVAMALSMAAKQMYVTFPFVLLLLDYWPLNRLRSAGDVMPRVLEKARLFVLAIAGSLIAVVGQRNLHAVASTESLSLGSRTANAFVAYLRYLGKLFVPIDLAVPYPLTLLAMSTVIGSLLALIVITAVVILVARRAPYLPVGWFWFIGTLVPVIGIVAIGAQSMADRYSYFSYIGIWIALTFAALSLPLPRRALAAAGVVLVAVYAAMAFHQVGYWVDSETLFTHTLAITPPNPVAEYSLGQTLELTRPEASIEHLGRAIALTEEALAGRTIGPDLPGPDWYVQAYIGRGAARLMSARNQPAAAARVLITDAIKDFEQAKTLQPDAAHLNNNLLVAHQMLAAATNGPRPNAAKLAYNAAISEGVKRLNSGDPSVALGEFRKAQQIEPQSAAPPVYLALTLLKMNQPSAAVTELRAAKKADAVKANDYITSALNMPPSPDNLDRLIARLSAELAKR